MRHSFVLASAFVLLVMLFPVHSSNADIVTFDFTAADGSDLDGGGAGDSITGVPTGADTATLTNVSVTAPEFDGSGVLTGATLDAETNITFGGQFGVNNLSIGNGAFDTATGAGSSESSNFNFLESWTFEFDEDITFVSIDFASLGGGENFDVTIGTDTFSFADGAAGDIFNDPFAGLEIAAGTDITFTANGSLGGTNIRIDEFVVDVVAAVPEPGSALFGCIAFGLLSTRRRRKN